MEDSSPTKKKWLPTTERFTAFVDIMGFKDMVMRNNHDEIYNLLNELYLLRDSIDNVKKMPMKYELDSIKTVSFSDSIIFFTKNNTFECFYLLSMALSWFFAKSIEKGIPMKGAISLGEISVNINRQIYFGQPLIDAYLLEEDVNYYGVVVHHTVEKFINNIPVKQHPLINDLYFDEITPLKSGRISHVNLNWFKRVDKGGDGEELIVNSVTRLMRKQKEITSGNPRRYIDNTLELVKKLPNHKN